MAACGSPKDAASTAPEDTTPYKVGIVYSQTGALASYGKLYIDGFNAGLAYATSGTNKVGSHPIQVDTADDAGDPTKAVAAATDFIGKGYNILAGSTASGVGLAVAPVAADNQVVFISGAAATDALTGINKYTFRSGRQSLQDVETAKAIIGDVTGKKVVVFRQEGAFGDANFNAVNTILGGAGATVTDIKVPASESQFSTWANQALQAAPDLLFVAWAGTTAPVMWEALDQQGVLAATTVSTGLDIRATWPTFGAAGTKISFLAHYVDGAAENPAYDALKAAVGTTDLFDPDGFTAAQLIVHALEAGTNADDQIKALEGYSFDGVKGSYTVRPEDHALLQPMFEVQLSGSGTDFTAKVVKTFTPDQVAPPVTPFK